MRAFTLFVSDIWAIARPYWFSGERWAGRGLLAVIVAMSLGLVFINVLLNKWNNAFYDTLQNHDLQGFYRQIGLFCLLAAAYIVVAVYQLYLRQMLQIRWRAWLTRHLVDRWLSGQAYYAMQMRGQDTDNPDQRLADDVGLFVNQTLTLTLGFLESVVTLVSFVGILWGLSGTLTFTLAATTLTVPGYMVWTALLYALVGTLLTRRVGRPLIRLNYDQQRYEADFRFSLVRFRENVEGVALYRGEQGEAAVFSERFSQVVANWWNIMRRRKRLAWLTTGYAQAAVIFPFLACAPRYFSGAMQLGDLMQTASAFGHVQGALSWFVDAYAELAAWKATVDRLTSFASALENAHARPDGAPRLALETGEDETLRFENLTLARPDGQPLIEAVNLRVAPGDRVLLGGPSGAGKSALFRAVAGLWPYGSGRIILPRSADVFFLPQKPYLPMGTLRNVVAYPAPDGRFSDPSLQEALAACGLKRLTDRLDDAAYWAQQLSPGEQQRLAFARLLLHKRAFMLLDEATSAVDPEGERALYELLFERLPGAAVVSVGHREALAGLHSRRLTVRAPHGGPGRLVAAS